MSKKGILIVYPEMYIGGSTTSLISLLNELDYTKYSVDLLLATAPGQLAYMIPSDVNILPSPKKYRSKTRLRLRKVFSIYSIVLSFHAIIVEKTHKSINARQQITQRDSVRYTIAQKKKYDIAISFLEMWPMYYLVDKVNASKKIAWYHIDFIGAGMVADYDRRQLKDIHQIVLVSDQCKKSFDRAFPEYAYKSMVIENILSKTYVQKRATESITYELMNYNRAKIRMISVCRIDFKSKGLDRGTLAIRRLKDEGLADNLIWYIVGDGKDKEALQDMINVQGLDSIIVLCGAVENPMPLLKQCEVFFLPSRYEGKPMSVAEAMMLGLVPIITNYASAKEQVLDGIEGVVMENTDEGIYSGLKDVLQGKYDLKSMKKNVAVKEFDNSAIRKVEALLD